MVAASTLSRMERRSRQSLTTSSSSTSTMQDDAQHSANGIWNGPGASGILTWLQIIAHCTSGSASNWLAMKGGEMVDWRQEGKRYGLRAKTSLADSNAAGRAGITAGDESDE